MSTTVTKVGLPDEKEPQQDEEVSLIERILRTVVDVSLHYLPQLAIIAISVPLIIIVSLIAGLIVRNSVPQPWERRVFFQYGESPIPIAHFQLPPLVADQAYDISVHLTVPHTDISVSLGNFMTYLNVTTPSNKTLIAARKPAAILPKAPKGPIRRLLSLSSSGYVDVTISILPDWIPGTSSPLFATLEVGRRDSWKSLGSGEGREVTILEAFVRGSVQLHGTRRLVSKYPNVAGVLSSVSFFVTAALGLVLCFYRFSAPFEGRQMRGKGMTDSGLPMPPKPVPRILEGRPKRMSTATTPRAFVKRESSPSYSESSATGDLPTIPTPESGLIHSSPYQGLSTDEEDDGTASI
ncbi:hypothetical protein FRC14_006412 [Serendipita sp. 396]|nr:hypothetical protein FRC14_006412 [Serendipita sp. 396]KAG8784375.1 hypothetical protein FRC15_003363 [Serendipita sp. 397]KAG8861261.1 hypothetical protein FRC20_011490 [Serendipita sp. 405]